MGPLAEYLKVDFIRAPRQIANIITFFFKVIVGAVVFAIVDIRHSYGYA